MQSINWSGVFPAITTPFTASGEVDTPFAIEHAQWLASHAVQGLVVFGSLGEGATLTLSEKRSLLQAWVQAVGHHIPVIATVSALSTQEAVQWAQQAVSLGAKGLMILPPYIYKGSHDEIMAHIKAVLRVSRVPCMLYNNPAAYGVDILPEHVAQLAQHHAHLTAVKESSGDVRRIFAIRALVGARLQILAGLDDTIVEAVRMGADGWVAGLVNALPKESIQLYELAKAGHISDVHALYQWFLPLLRLDTHVKFVQYIKLVQSEVNMGSEHVRAPRQILIGQERETVLSLIRGQLNSRI